MNSKRKGNAGELELLHLLEGYGLTVRRNDQRYTGAWITQTCPARWTVCPSILSANGQKSSPYTRL